MPDARTRDVYPYAVFVLSSDSWGDAVWTGDARGHDDALVMADRTHDLAPSIAWPSLRVLTVCMCDDGPPTMIEHKLSRTVERVA